MTLEHWDLASLAAAAAMLSALIALDILWNANNPAQTDTRKWAVTPAVASPAG